MPELETPEHQPKAKQPVSRRVAEAQRKTFNHVRRRLPMADRDFTDFTDKELPIRVIREIRG